MQTRKHAVSVFTGTVLAVIFFLLVASGGLILKATAPEGTLTPEAYLPLVSRQGLDAPTPTPTLEPTPDTDAIVVDHDCVDAGAIPQTWLDQARALDTFFTHKSVGNNILDGMADLQSQDPGRYTIAVYSGAASWFATHDGLLHTQVGSNGEPLTKIDGFDSAIRNDGYHVAEAAMMKFCPGDTPPFSDTPASTAWAAYRDMMADLEHDYPEVTFVWWTFPLATAADNRGNDEKAVFNDAIRAHCAANGCVLFDIAAIESHDPSGNPVVGPAGYEAMYNDYASDGAHLNEMGRQRVARAMWWLLARIAGWDGT